MSVVSDSSPLITFAKLGCFPLLERLFLTISISTEVYQEIVIAGAGLVGSREVSSSAWIETYTIRDSAKLVPAQNRTGLGLGELSSIFLAKEIHANLILLDDLGARKLAHRQGLRVQGCVGILEACHRKKYLLNLREIYIRMLEEGVFLNRQLLNDSLERFNLPMI